MRLRTDDTGHMVVERHPLRMAQSRPQQSSANEPRQRAWSGAIGFHGNLQACARSVAGVDRNVESERAATEISEGGRWPRLDGAGVNFSGPPRTDSGFDGIGCRHETTVPPQHPLPLLFT